MSLTERIARFLDHLASPNDRHSERVLQRRAQLTREYAVPPGVDPINSADKEENVEQAQDKRDEDRRDH
jgi:hypothetical protein